MKWYLKAIKRYANFKGRARRKEFWWFTLLNIMIIVALLLIIDMSKPTSDFNSDITILFSIYYLATIIPALAVCVRRLHDTGRSGRYCVFGIIPIIGICLLVFWLCQDSQSGENEYGLNPKEAVD